MCHDGAGYEGRCRVLDEAFSGDVLLSGSATPLSAADALGMSGDEGLRDRYASLTVGTGSHGVGGLWFVK